MRVFLFLTLLACGQVFAQTVTIRSDVWYPINGTPGDDMPCFMARSSELVNKIDNVIQKEQIIKKRLPNYVLENPHIVKIIKGAELLFEGIPDIHSEEGLTQIVKRYFENK